MKFGTTRHAREICAGLDILYPDGRCSLEWTTPLELLVATILSAQCTDARVNIVAKTLFQKYRSVADFATAPIEELENDIRSTGFYKNKAKNIRECCRQILERFDGEVPHTMEELVTLAGVGRKTANCVLVTAFGIAEGVVVDTHVFRTSRRLGLSEGNTPEKVEQDLMKVVAKKRWVDISHQLVLFGRHICSARKPSCETCPFSERLCKERQEAAPK
ncbi:MAG: endonuclease III [Planctomycetia bacterium]|nr:endonuclease III [Planctomycetia bacterium]